MNFFKSFFVSKGKNLFILKFGNFLSKQIEAEEHQLVVDCLEEDKKAIYVDLGCLDGNTTTVYARKIKPAKIFGLDLFIHFLKRGSKEFQIIGKKCNLNKTFPLEDNSVDVVTTSHSIEHLTDTDNFLSEVKRVLKPKGYVVISTDNLASWMDIFFLILGKQPRTGPTISTKYLVTTNPLWWESGEGGIQNIEWPMHHNVMTMKTLELLLTRYGFKVEKVLGAGYPPVPYPFASFFTKLDLYHSMFMVIKARKI